MDTGTEEVMDESGNVVTKGTTSIHVTALDGLINVNSLFTFAVFVGLSLTPSCQTSSPQNSACNAREDSGRNLLTFQVISFSSFLFSSLIAQGLKQGIILFKNGQLNGVIHAHTLRIGLVLSAMGSVLGCICLMLALVDVIQIELGTLSSGSIWTIKAIIPLVTLVPTALIIYICTILYAFLH